MTTSGLCVVTGGSRGIGRAIVHRMAADGYRVIATGRDEAALAETASTAPAPVETATLDVTDPVQVEEFFAGKEVTVLGINAGIAPSAPVHRLTLEEWEHTMSVNATGPFLCTKAVLPGMRERDYGRIVTVASIASHVGSRYTAAYTASKHAALGFIRAVAAEVAGTGVTANAVCPAYVDSPMTDASVARMAEKTGRSPEDIRRTLADFTPLGRLLQPEEIANAVAFLASPESAAINGHSIVLDGGGLQR